MSVHLSNLRSDVQALPQEMADMLRAQAVSMSATDDAKAVEVMYKALVNAMVMGFTVGSTLGYHSGYMIGSTEYAPFA